MGWLCSKPVMPSHEVREPRLKEICVMHDGQSRSKVMYSGSDAGVFSLVGLQKLGLYLFCFFMDANLINIIVFPLVPGCLKNVVLVLGYCHKGDSDDNKCDQSKHQCPLHGISLREHLGLKGICKGALITFSLLDFFYSAFFFCRLLPNTGRPMLVLHTPVGVILLFVVYQT